MPIDFEPNRVAATLHSRATAGARRAGAYLADKVKGLISKQAPVRKGRALTRATPGAPPRRVTGRLVATVRYTADTRTGVVRVSAGTPGQYLERRGHPFLGPALRRWGGEAARIALGIA